MFTEIFDSQRLANCRESALDYWLPVLRNEQVLDRPTVAERLSRSACSSRVLCEGFAEVELFFVLVFDVAKARLRTECGLDLLV